MKAARGDAHDEALSRLGLDPRIISGLSKYLAQLAAWNRRANLTGARTCDGRVATLVAPVLPLAPLLKGDSLIDVGSGNGSPGLVLALARPELRVTLLEPRQKRWAFLRDTARSLGRSDIVVLRARHDEYTGAAAANVTLRALTLPLEELGPLVVQGGRLLVLGSAPAACALFAAEPPIAGAPALHRFRRR